MIPGRRRHTTLRYSATRTIAAPIDRVHAVLRDLARIGEWNPAISRVVTGPSEVEVGRWYPGTVRGVVSVRIRYDAITGHSVRFTIEGAGATERGEWSLACVDATATLVTHTFAHSGLVLRLMARAFVPVASWRLERLEEEALRR